MKDSKWIQKAIGKKGALHKQMGIPLDEKIPVKALKKETQGKSLKLSKVSAD